MDCGVPMCIDYSNNNWRFTEFVKLFFLGTYLVIIIFKSQVSLMASYSKFACTFFYHFVIINLLY